MANVIPINKSSKADAAPQSDATAEELLAFERMLADLSARFANVPAQQVEFEIQVAQAVLREFLGFDRSTFAEFQEDGSLVVLSSTAVEGVETTSLGPLPSQLSWFVAKLRNGEIFALQDAADDLPPEAIGEAEYVRLTGLHSQLSIPLRIGGTIIGAIAFAAFRETRAWPADQIAR
jgi:formate hydrogenlyase transcriptional activator